MTLNRFRTDFDSGYVFDHACSRLVVGLSWAWSRHGRIASGSTRLAGLPSTSLQRLFAVCKFQRVGVRDHSIHLQFRRWKCARLELPTPASLK